jgi:hypothetical protein
MIDLIILRQECRKWFSGSNREEITQYSYNTTCAFLIEMSNIDG